MIWVLLAESASALAARLGFIYVTSVVTGLIYGLSLSRVSLSAIGGLSLYFLARAAYCAIRRTPLEQAPTVGLRRPRDLVELVVIAIMASTVSSGLVELLRSGAVGITWEAFVTMTARNAVLDPRDRWRTPGGAGQHSTARQGSRGAATDRRAPGSGSWSSLCSSWQPWGWGS